MPDSPPASRISISRKVILGVVFTLVMLALIALTSVFATRRFQNNSEAINDTREVLEMSERMLRHLTEMENGVRGYLLAGDEEFLVPYKHGHSFIMQDLQKLMDLAGENEDHMTPANAEQQARIRRLRTLLGQAFETYGKAISQRSVSDTSTAAAIFSAPDMVEERTAIFGAVQDELVEFDQLERRNLRDLSESNEDIGRVNISLIAGGTSLTFIALLVACLFILRDISARSRAEEELQMERNLLNSIMDTIPDQIFVKDIQGRYLRDNAAHRRSMGIRSQDEIVGKTARDLFPPHLADQAEATDMEVFQSRKPLLNYEQKRQTQDGREFWLEMSKAPLQDTSGRLLGLVGVSSDITVRRNSEEQKKHYAQQLQRSNEELQNFASVASHDLQEPLRKIQAFGDRLRMRCGAVIGPDGLEYLNRMLDAARRMQVLIQDILKLSRVTTRGLPFERCDLAEIIRGVLSDLEIRISQSHAVIKMDNLPVIDGDPTQLRQLFQNLIANSLKFHKPDVNPEVTLTTRLFENCSGELPQLGYGAPLCEVTLQDNGIGFDQKFADQIFIVFQRLHTRQEYEGTGIGLAVCRKIADRHRGKIEALSTDGQGATFIITLPVNQPDNLRS